jgi:hypothetical protein
MTLTKMMAAALAVGSMTAHAADADFCVTTTSELRAALAAASDGGANQDDRVFIAVAAGTYSTSDDGGGRFFYRNTSSTSVLQMWGGFNADCSQKSDNASLSILDGANSSEVLVASSTSAYLDILTLTIQNANTNQPGAGIDINDTNDDTTGEVLLRDLIIRNNHTSGAFAGFRAFTRGNQVLYFDNNLIVDNSAGTNYVGELYGEGQVYVRYNTVANNTAPNTSTGGVFCYGTPTCEIANSVFWMNSNTDLYLFGDTNMYFDDVGNLGGVVPSTNANPISGDPIFVDPAAGNYHLGDGSPLLGVSTYLDSGTDNDIDGHALPFTGTTDVGAHIDTIFNDKFESP